MIIQREDVQAACQEPNRFHKRIGSTTYRIGIHFNPESTETFDEKVLRLLENSFKNTLQISPENDTINMLQTGRLPEGSSL